MQCVFMRYELKYLIDREQKEAVLRAMREPMQPDRFGRTSIRNLYYDTPNYRLARRSIEAPCYKEKLRVRSYARVTDADDTVFVELKKKYQSVVYKRRLPLPEGEAMHWTKPRDDSQIAEEISSFLSFYRELRPVVFLSYDREAFAGENDLRITFDENIRFRQTELSLRVDPWGTQLLPPDMTLIEIKCGGSYPLWLAHVLSENRIYKTSFSKYGRAYQTIFQEEALQYA